MGTFQVPHVSTFPGNSAREEFLPIVHGLFVFCHQVVVHHFITTVC